MAKKDKTQLANLDEFVLLSEVGFIVPRSYFDGLQLFDGSEVV